MDRGILYIAVGEEFVDEATRSAQSVRKHMGDIDIAVATESFDHDLEQFDYKTKIQNTKQIVDNDRTWLLDTIIKPEYSPFDKTLYLDTDTYLCDDVSELFGLLDRYELAIARTPEQNNIETLPEPWHHYNTGVVAYQDTPNVKQLLYNWERIFKHRVATQDEPLDQPSFGESLYLSDVRWYTLPQRYNVRFTKSGRDGFIADDPKIVHGRGSDPRLVAEKLNKVDGPRVYRAKFRSPATPLVQTGPIYRPEIVAETISELTRSFVWVIRNRGVTSLPAEIIQYIGSNLWAGRCEK